MKYRFQCAECGYAYKSFWYEPNWIAKRFYLTDHKSFHYNSWLNDYPSQWKRHGAEMERERILNLLENPLHHNIRFPNEHTDCYTCVLLALIKGEK